MSAVRSGGNRSLSSSQLPCPRACPAPLTRCLHAWLAGTSDSWLAARSQKGTYHYKVDLKALKATAFGDMAEDMPECSGGSMYELEKAMVDVR